jgi:hypothetical protein
MSTPTPIDIPFLPADNLELRLTVGACRLRIRPGDGPQWVAGTYDDPSNAVPLRIDLTDNSARISQTFDWPNSWGSFRQPPTFDLFLGKGRPYMLTIEGGASEAELDLGGLPLRRLTVKYGAGKQEIEFSAPNPEPMDQLTVACGAASLEMEGLANASFAEMTLEGGAAGYELDFGGVLRRDALVRINAAVSAVEISVPASTAVKMSGEAIMGGIDTGDGFMKREGAWWNEAALAGKTPCLTIHARMTMGGVRLEQTPAVSTGATSVVVS